VWGKWWTDNIRPILKLIGITSASQVAGINGGLAIWNLITTVILAQFVERIGRRPLWIFGTVGILGTFAIITGLSVSIFVDCVHGVPLD
jgi:MFS family permease